MSRQSLLRRHTRYERPGHNSCLELKLPGYQQFNAGNNQVYSPFKLRILNGNEVSRITALLVWDPAAGIVRRPGATLLIGGALQHTSGPSRPSAFWKRKQNGVVSSLQK